MYFAMTIRAKAHAFPQLPYNPLKSVPTPRRIPYLKIFLLRIAVVCIQTTRLNFRAQSTARALECLHQSTNCFLVPFTVPLHSLQMFTLLIWV